MIGTVLQSVHCLTLQCSMSSERHMRVGGCGRIQARDDGVGGHKAKRLVASLQSATEELERLEHAFDSVKKQLFDRLHGILREQLFHDNAASGAMSAAMAASPAPLKSAEPQHDGSSSSDKLVDVTANGASKRLL